jgi:tight adherence protein B
MAELLQAAPLSVLRLCWIALAALAIAVGAPRVYASTWPPFFRALAQRASARARQLRFLRVECSEARLRAAELGVWAVALGGAVTGTWLVALLAFVPSLVAQPVLDLACSRRTQRMEGQLDHWLSSLAASLRVTPALGQALAYSAGLVTAPLRDELNTLIDELALGLGVDEGLARMADRIGSRSVRSAVGTLRVGRNTGGQLPELLERSAAVLREMARLEGVFRTKTAEGRAQASVVSVMPFALLAMLHWLDPKLIAPLFATQRGHLVLGAAGALWVGQLLAARRILHVDY